MASPGLSDLLSPSSLTRLNLGQTQWGTGASFKPFFDLNSIINTDYVTGLKIDTWKETEWEKLHVGEGETNWNNYLGLLYLTCRNSLTHWCGWNTNMCHSHECTHVLVGWFFIWCIRFTQHGGALVSAVAPQEEGPGFETGLSHVLPVPTWVFSSYSSFLP